MERRTFMSNFAQLALLTMLPSALANTTASGTAHWHNKPHLPKHLQELYPCLFGKHLVVAGALELADAEQGTMGVMNASNACYLFDLVKQQWRYGPFLPVRRHHLGLVSTEHGILAVGGFAASKSDPWQACADTFLLSRLSGHWHSSIPLPSPQAESGYANIAGNAHVISGRGIVHGRLTDVAEHVFFDGTKWQYAAPAPLPRNSGACVSMDRGCLLIGGRIQEKNHENQSRVDFYDQRSDRWFELAPMPQACAGIAAAKKDNKIYVFGGEQYNLISNHNSVPIMKSKTFNKIWEYDFSRDRWQALPITMTTTRHGLGAVTTNEGIYLIGGAKRPGGEMTTNYVELLSFNKHQT